MHFPRLFRGIAAYPRDFRGRVKSGPSGGGKSARFCGVQEDPIGDQGRWHLNTPGLLGLLSENQITIPLRLVALAAPQDPVAQVGFDCGTLTRPFGGGYVTTSTGGGAPALTVDPRYVYRDF